MAVQNPDQGEEDVVEGRRDDKGKFLPGRSSALVESHGNRRDAATDPRMREFVSHMTDPTSEAFGVPTKAAVAAGYAANNGYALMRRPDVQAAINAIQKERMERGREVVEYLQTYDMQGARELVDQLFYGKESVRLIDPEKEFGPGAASALEVVRDAEGNPALTKAGKPVVLDHTRRLREINLHNKNAIKAAEVRAKAAELHLAYLLGRPEQSIKLREEGGHPDVLGMGKMKDEELMILMAAAKELLDHRGRGQAEVVVEEGDFEVVDE